MSKLIASRIQTDPRYLELKTKRDALAWILSAIVCVLYFGFILMVAFTPDILTSPVTTGGVIPVGMFVGVGVIVASCLLTGVYVYQANAVFDPLIHELIKDASK